MNVASRELSAELYKISGWQPSAGWGRDEHGDMQPQYDLGYLMRKLPAIIPHADTLLVIAKQESGSYWASYFKKFSDGFYADIPEDAACQLAIQLFKQGILTK